VGSRTTLGVECHPNPCDEPKGGQLSRMKEPLQIVVGPEIGGREECRSWLPAADTSNTIDRSEITGEHQVYGARRLGRTDGGGNGEISSFAHDDEYLSCCPSGAASPCRILNGQAISMGTSSHPRTASMVWRSTVAWRTVLGGRSAARIEPRPKGFEVGGSHRASLERSITACREGHREVTDRSPGYQSLTETIGEVKIETRRSPGVGLSHLESHQPAEEIERERHANLFTSPRGRTIPGARLRYVGPLQDLPFDLAAPAEGEHLARETVERAHSTSPGSPWSSQQDTKGEIPLQAGKLGIYPGTPGCPGGVRSEMRHS
jgi:hypothetical protein